MLTLCQKTYGKSTTESVRMDHLNTDRPSLLVPVGWVERTGVVTESPSFILLESTKFRPDVELTMGLPSLPLPLPQFTRSRGMKSEDRNTTLRRHRGTGVVVFVNLLEGPHNLRSSPFVLIQQGSRLRDGRMVSMDLLRSREKNGPSKSVSLQ